MGGAVLDAVVKAEGGPAIGVGAGLEMEADLVDVVEAGSIEVGEAGIEVEAADVGGLRPAKREGEGAKSNEVCEKKGVARRREWISRRRLRDDGMPRNLPVRA